MMPWIKTIAFMAQMYLLQLVLPDGQASLAIIPLLIAGGIGAAVGSMAGRKPKPELRDPAAEYDAAYSTQIKYAPKMLAMEKYYQPEYTDLALSQQERTLMGTPQQAGVLDIISRAQPQIDELTARSASAQRGSDVADVEAYGGRATQAFRDAAGTSQILNQLQSQAEEELSGDGILDPRLRREFQQSVRQGQAARGGGFGPSDIGEEAAFTAMQANQLRRDRQRFGQSVVGTLQGTSVDPFMAILGRPGQAMAAGQGAFGQAAGIQSGAGPSGMFGMNNYFAGIGDYNANAKNASNIAAYNARMGLLGGMIQGGASLAGAYGMGRMGQGKSFFPGG